MRLRRLPAERVRCENGLELSPRAVAERTDVNAAIHYRVDTAEVRQQRRTVVTLLEVRHRVCARAGVRDTDGVPVWRQDASGCGECLGNVPLGPDLRHTHRTWMDEDGIAEAVKAQRVGHQMPGIRGVYAHVTEPMHRPLLETLQERWLDSGDYW